MGQTVLSEFAQKGEELYKLHIRPEISEEQLKGKIVAIDVDTGKYYVLCLPFAPVTLPKSSFPQKEMPLPNFETCLCPICENESAELFLEAPDRFHLKNGDTYSIQRCTQCGMVYLNPRPTEASSSEYYQHEEYLPFSSLSDQPTLTERLYGQLRRANLRWKRKLVTRFRSTGKLLDVGCGTGEFLAEMRAAGWQVRGLERDPSAAEWGRLNLDLDIQSGDLTEFEGHDFEFDVITLWHVLEHLYSPRQAFARLHHLLKDDGVLIVAVPNIAGVDARAYGRYWVALDTPRHVNHFSLPTLERLAAQTGFVLRFAQQLPLDAFFNTLMSERLEAAAQGTGAWLWPFRLVRAKLVAIASLIAGSRLPFCRATGGATVVAVFRK